MADKKKESSSERKRRLSRERTAKKNTFRQQKAAKTQTPRFLRALGETLFGDQLNKKALEGQRYKAPNVGPEKPRIDRKGNKASLKGQKYKAPKMGKGSNMGKAGRLATRGGALAKQGSSALTRVGAGSRFGPFGMAIAGGAIAGEAYRRNAPEGVSSSARGEGRAAFAKGNKKQAKKDKDKPQTKSQTSGHRSVADRQRGRSAPAPAPAPGPKATEGAYTISRKGKKQATKNKIEARDNKPKKTPKSTAPKSSKPPKPASRPAARPAPKRDRMAGASSESRMTTWALANRKMIEKSGTRKQREILRKALGK